MTAVRGAAAALGRWLRQLLRVAASHHVLNGMAAAAGLAVVSAVVHTAFSAPAAAAAAVGAIVVIPSDLAAPRRRKLWQLVPAAVIGLPLFHAVQLLHGHPWALSTLLVPATFVAFLGAAWGKRGLPISMSVMFAMLFSMATRHTGQSAVFTTGWCAVGMAGYLAWATAANALLNRRYRAQMVADTLLAVAALMRTQALQLAAPALHGEAPLVGRVLARQAALADQLQAARDVVLEAPVTPRRQQLAALLLRVLEIRDRLVSCELDVDRLAPQAAALPAMAQIGDRMLALAEQADRVAEALLLARRPQPSRARPTATAQPAMATHVSSQPPATTPDAAAAALVRGLAFRVEQLQEEMHRLTALACGGQRPDLAEVEAGWRLFVGPTAWSWKPLLALRRWDAPPLRHALRAAGAMATGQAVAMALPWGTHDYWILLTIAVVLRGSLAQTLERRNARVAGTLLGCLLAAALLQSKAPAWVVLAAVAVSQGVAHAFAIRRYLVTSVAATVLALLQSHLLEGPASPAFQVTERLADTLIGVAIAWAFAYVLPSWERTQVPALVRRVLAAQARHARLALAPDDTAPGGELAWRLARREVYDSLSALVQATQRALSEPRAVRPPLRPLALLLGHGYQLLAQLTAIKGMLQRPGRIDRAQVEPAMSDAAAAIALALSAAAAAPPAGAAGGVGNGSADGTDAGIDDGSNGIDAADDLPDPFVADLVPWLLRRLRLATAVAQRLRIDAQPLLASQPAGR